MEILGQLASVPSGAAALRLPIPPAVPKHPNTHIRSQAKVIQVTAGAKGPPLVFMGAAHLESDKWECCSGLN